MITPEQLAASGTEDGAQLALMCWCSLNFKTYPELKWLHHSPNGGSRHKAEASKFKAMGMKPGFPDLVLLVKRGAFSGLLIELKVKNRKASDKQLNWAEHLRANGFGYKLCNGWIEARNVLVEYLNYEKERV